MMLEKLVSIVPLELTARMREDPVVQVQGVRVLHRLLKRGTDSLYLR